jgi:hypothetical protein
MADEPNDTKPARVLDDLAQLRRRARVARRSYWFPLVAFGVLTVAATPLYGQRLPTCATAGACGFPGDSASGLFGTTFLDRSSWIAAYWLVAMPAGYLATVWYYRRHASRSGVAGSVLPFAWLGLGLLLACLVGWLLAFPFPVFLTTFHGTLPILILALGLMLLAWLERSPGLGAFAVCFLALALVVNLYDVENLIGDLAIYHNGAFSNLPNIVLPGLVLLTAGAAFRLSAARSRARQS